MTSDNSEAKPNSDSITNAMKSAIDRETPIVVPAGNSGPNYYTTEFPGTVREAITVGATSSDGRIWGKSSRGPTLYEKLIKPEIVCVGVNVENTVPDENGNLQTKTMTGTSVANSLAGGVVGLIKSAHPDWGPKRIKNALVCTAKPLKYAGEYYDVFTQGGGLVQADEAVETDIIVQDSVLNFGAIYEPGSLTRQISIENISSDDITVEVTPYMQKVGSNEDVTGKIQLSETKLCLNQRGREKIGLRINVPESVGIYSGRLLFNELAGERLATAIFGFVRFDRNSSPSKPNINRVRTDTQR